MELPNNMKQHLVSAPWVKCECDGQVFEPSLMFKKLSSLLSPTGKEEMVPVEVFKCSVCQKIPAFVHKKIPGIPTEMKAISIEG